MRPEVFAFRWVPPFAQGLVRDFGQVPAYREEGLDLFESGAIVLHVAERSDLVARHPALDAYVRRCEARPPFQKALADQLAPFAENASSDGRR